MVRLANTDGKLDWNDYVRFPADGQRHELIDGVHVVTPSPVRKHQTIVLNIASSIRTYLRARRTGHVYVAPFDVILSHHDIVEPDVLYISRERAQTIETAPWVKGAPSLVVEVSSPSTRERDQTTKRALYEQVGVDEYWFVDAEGDAVRIFRRAADRFARAIELRLDANDVLTTPLLPDWTLPLLEVFEE